MTRFAPLRLILGRGSSRAYVPVGGIDSPAVLDAMPFTLVDCVRERTGSGDISSTETARLRGARVCSNPRSSVAR